jgi:hypothetical protein
LHGPTCAYGRQTGFLIPANEIGNNPPVARAEAPGAAMQCDKSDKKSQVMATVKQAGKFHFSLRRQALAQHQAEWHQSCQ